MDVKNVSWPKNFKKCAVETLFIQFWSHWESNCDLSAQAPQLSALFRPSDGLPLRSSSWTLRRPAENSLHHFRTFFTFHTFSPYTSSNWWWISIGGVFFACKNLMTECNSHLAGATTGTSIANGSHVETERPNELRQVSIGGGEPGSSV
jgi:hypothetical protein